MDRAVEPNFSAPPETQMKKRAPHAPASDKQPEGLIYENVELRSSFSRLGKARTSSALHSAYRKRRPSAFVRPDRPGNRRHPQTVRLRLPATIRFTTANITIISDFPTSLHVGLDVEPQRTLAAGKIDAQYLEKPAPLAARIETHGHTQRISGHNRLSVIFQRGTSARRFAPDDYERLPAPIAETRFEPRRFAAVETSETQGIRHVRMQRFGRNCDNGARKCPMPTARAAAAKQHEHHADGRAASPKSTPQPPHG